jgi:hypothetical protein
MSRFGVILCTFVAIFIIFASILTTLGGVGDGLDISIMSWQGSVGVVDIIEWTYISVALIGFVNISVYISAIVVWYVSELIILNMSRQDILNMSRAIILDISAQRILNVHSKLIYCICLQSFLYIASMMSRKFCIHRKRDVWVLGKMRIHRKCSVWKNLGGRPVMSTSQC